MAKAGSRVVHTPAAELALNSAASPCACEHVQRPRRHARRRHRGATGPTGSPPRSATRAVSRGCASALGAREGTPEHMAAQTRVYRAMADAGVSLDMFTPVGDGARLHGRRSGRSTASARSSHGLGLGCTSHSADSPRSRWSARACTASPASWPAWPSCSTRPASTSTRRPTRTPPSRVLVPAEQTETAVRALHDGFDWRRQSSDRRSEFVIVARTVRRALTAIARARCIADRRRPGPAHLAGRAGPDESAPDIATGAGHTAIALAQAGAEVIASDLTVEMLAETADNFAANGLPTTVARRRARPAVRRRVVRHRDRAHGAAPFRGPGGASCAEVARVLRAGGRFGLEDQVAPSDTEAAELINRSRSSATRATIASCPAEWTLVATPACVVDAEVFDKWVEFDWWTSSRTSRRTTRISRCLPTVRTAHATGTLRRFARGRSSDSASARDHARSSRPSAGNRRRLQVRNASVTTHARHGSGCQSRVAQYGG